MEGCVYLMLNIGSLQIWDLGFFVICRKAYKIQILPQKLAEQTYVPDKGVCNWLRKTILI